MSLQTSVKDHVMSKHQPDFGVRVQNKTKIIIVPTFHVYTYHQGLAGDS